MAPSPSIDEVRSEIRNLVAELAECEPHEIKDTTHFLEDLDIDSLTSIELMVAMDKRFKIDIPEEAFRNVENLQQSVELVMDNLHKEQSVERALAASA